MHGPAGYVKTKISKRLKDRKSELYEEEPALWNVDPEKRMKRSKR